MKLWRRQRRDEKLSPRRNGLKKKDDNNVKDPTIISNK